MEERILFGDKERFLCWNKHILFLLFILAIFSFFYFRCHLFCGRIFFGFTSGDRSTVDFEAQNAKETSCHETLPLHSFPLTDVRRCPLHDWMASWSGMRVPLGASLSSRVRWLVAVADGPEKVGSTSAPLSSPTTWRVSGPSFIPTLRGNRGRGRRRSMAAGWSKWKEHESQLGIAETCLLRTERGVQDSKQSPPDSNDTSSCPMTRVTYVVGPWDPRDKWTVYKSFAGWAGLQVKIGFGRPSGIAELEQSWI